MSNSVSYALTGVLVEAHNQGLDIDAIIGTVSGGVMGAALYAPASADRKPKEVESLNNSLAHAKEIISINA